MTINFFKMQLTKRLLFSLAFAVSALSVSAQELAYELPKHTAGVKRPVISLNGEWQFQFDAKSEWDVIQVPGEAVMQGYGIAHDKSFFYKRKFSLPNDFKGKKIVLRFDGVYSQATLSINGKVLRTHKGGFSRWETDISPYVSFDKPNEVFLEVQDQVDDISYASGYAHHPIGGILRDVTLFATAGNGLFDFGVETDLDRDFKDAELRLSYGAEVKTGTTVQYVLSDQQGKPVPQSAGQFTVNNGKNINSFKIANPLKWDAEHPNLYRLEVKVKQDGKETYSFHKEIGFRTVKIVADQMLVNGKPVKLRGANRHDLHPTLGRVSTPYYDSLDVKLLKESHINFIRTSHYPPSERFVELCNRYGIYVEVETSVCFVDTYRQKNYAPGATQNDPNHTAQYLSQCREMVNTFKSHPAVVIWSIGNESQYGSNLKKGTAFWNEFAKTAKPEGYQGHAVGYGEWGIVDVWRRPKPEFWSTKKAQSPIRILEEGKVIKNFSPNQQIQFSVFNRYDHTFLNEVKLEYVYEGKKKMISLPNINPHEKGTFQLPAENWQKGKSVLLNFIDRDGGIVDTYEYYFGERPVHIPVAAHQGELKLIENAGEFIIKGADFEIPVSKETGLIENAISKGKVFIKKGPFLNIDVNLNHLTGAEVRKSANKFLIHDKDWKKTTLSCSIKNGVALISIAGTYQGLNVSFEITVKPEGELTTNYRTTGEPNGYLREIGLKYYMPDDIDQLNWERDGYWNYYPEGAFAGNEGRVHLYESKQAAYGVKPVQAWDLDTHNYYYWSDKGARTEKPLTNKAKGMKENAYYYTLSGAQLSRLSAVSPQADIACRIDRMEDNQLILYINNKWDYPEIAWGNYCKTLEASPCNGFVTVRF